MEELTISLLVKKLNNVLEKKQSREQVASWAFQLIVKDVEVEDQSVFDLLKLVGSIDIEVEPNKYLYGNEDIQLWIDEVQKTTF